MRRSQTVYREGDALSTLPANFVTACAEVWTTEQ